MASLTQRSSLIAESVKNIPAIQKTQFQFLGWADSLEKEIRRICKKCQHIKATHLKRAADFDKDVKLKEYLNIYKEI